MAFSGAPGSLEDDSHFFDFEAFQPLSAFVQKRLSPPASIQQLPSPGSLVSPVQVRASGSSHSLPEYGGPSQRKRKSRRVQISAASRKHLENAFSGNPYPCDAVFQALQLNTGLPIKSIKTWFTNTRTRRRAKGVVANRMSVAKIATMERRMSTGSSSSIERYLAAPVNEEAVPLSTVKAAIERDEIPSPSISSLEGPVVFSEDGTECSFSVTESEISNASADSFACAIDGLALSSTGYTQPLALSYSLSSVNSMLFLDTRGFRKGRKQWPDQYRFANPPPPRSRTTANRYFCTWPGCESHFRYQSEWTRHEEAMHYQPFRWVCCPDTGTPMLFDRCYICEEPDISSLHIMNQHLTSCVGQLKSNRTFYRQDQFIKHIDRCHKVDISLFKGLVDTCSEYTMSVMDPSLACGFCDHWSLDWAERQAHISGHIKSGLRREHWRPKPACANCQKKLVLNTGSYCDGCATLYEVWDPSMETQLAAETSAPLYDHVTRLMWRLGTS